MRQTDFISKHKGERLPITDAVIDYYPQYLAQNTANQLMHGLMQKVDWQQYEVTVFGKTHPTPRLSAWYGERGYSYSGLYHQAQAWTEELQLLKNHLYEDFNLHFNSVLLNLYRDGNDSMGCHSDDEKDLGEHPIIASISLGVARHFHLLHKRQKSKYKLLLDHGDLLLMSGNTQQNWKHAIHKSKRIREPRINLTFRYIMDL